MKHYKFDVIIIGAGPAGVAAAGALAGTGISTALLEAGVYAGAENWSGCVYFAEILAEKDCFGPEAVEAAPYERRVLRRGTLVHNGLDVVGVELNDPEIFKDCYTVLRPVYDPYFAALARSRGAVHITGTTVTSLIRKNGKVTGVQTNRGPLYADVVFIAEGDASHLVRSERLERVTQPHYLQGVKAVLSLRPEEIEKRFRLGPGEGAAYELLIRNPAIGGRTARLNVGGFIYTNRDSLSVGYVVPLDNIRNSYRGGHDSLFEWMRGLPYLRELTKDAPLSAYGAKIIRSGGWRERPALVEDGLAVGGASVGLGVDIPFPNFTGPASATGLYFARAVKELLKRGKPFDAKNIEKAYLFPLRDSVYGKNALYLSRWPGYFGRSRVLFGRTVDVACGTARFLSTGSLVETGRFLRSHILSVRGLRELISDTFRALGALRLRRPFVKSAINPLTIGHWVLNLVKKNPARDVKLGIILHVNGRDVDAASLPWPAGSLITRLSPALGRALELIYANDGRPMQRKFEQAVRVMIRGLKITDFAVLPAFALSLFFIALGTAVWDAFRYYVLKTPVEKLLAEPVMAYGESLRRLRDLDAVKPPVSLDAKLATNTYRTDPASHIRTLWPEAVTAHSDMSQAGLWWVCPARVYVYDAPPLAGRGRVTVNFENCIKCESCWRAEPGRVQWGRHTDHKLIYRPESAAIDGLLDALRENPSSVPFDKRGNRGIEVTDEKLWHLDREIRDLCSACLNAGAAFQDAVAKLPPAADKSRKEWPTALGLRLAGRLSRLETALSNDGRPDAALQVQSDKKDIELRLSEGSLFHALYCSRRLEQRLRAWISNPSPDTSSLPAFAPSPGAELKAKARDARLLKKGERGGSAFSYESVSRIFPDRVVKQWEDGPMPGEWEETLRRFIFDHRDAGPAVVRALSSVNPALGLIAARQMQALSMLTVSGLEPEPGVCATYADNIEMMDSGDAVNIKGTVRLVPTAAAHSLLLASRGRGFIVPLASEGVRVTPTPAIGFRAAGLAEISCDCAVKKSSIIAAPEETAPDPLFYLAIALGAGDYLCVRVKEHAAGRIQFPGQMLDTEGRDGIAKLGAVKAMIARTEAWRLLLEMLFGAATGGVKPGIPDDDFDHLCAALAAMAFGPEWGQMGYDSGQVFGGFAYSEDDLLSRFYRDSALFRFLAPGHGASARLHAGSPGAPLDEFLPFALGSLKGIHGEPVEKLVRLWWDVRKRYAALPAGADESLAGEAEALLLGIRGLLVRTEQGLNEGTSMETEAAAVEVLLSLADGAVAKAGMSAGTGRVSPSAVFPVEPAGTPAELDMDYETFCTAPGKSYRSGSFLTTIFDRSPRFVPEMQLHDAKLRNRWFELADWFKKNCGEKTFDGLNLERYIEKIHRLPDEIITAAKENRWLATYIPQSEDGLGWRKAEYYILNSVAGSFGDAAIDLLIMASTSIGTTPILLGLEDELPRVREELAPLAQDETKLGEIGARLAQIIRSFSNPNPAWIKKEYEAVMKLVDARIRHTRVVKYLAANFLRAFYAAGIAGRRGDFSGFMSNLKHAGALFEKVMPDVRAALDELPRRERCHKLFLRYLGHGGVSAFALTEPTAGSDSGGVKTTGHVKSAKLTPLPDGRYAFYLVQDDEKSLRYLIDMDRIAFTGRDVAYVTPDGQKAAIKYDRYDYATDQGLRYYVYQGRECEFHDIGQVRKTDSGPGYEYYSLTGAKMWITNASIATQFCLYAQTPEGVTGFMVDRHSEGLKVGADERKTGQRGSPTNEISIDGVRVPREAVIGYEGHGQVNALETLNVGRCGLAVVSGALMRKLMEEARKAVSVSPERDALLGEAAAILFGCESLAYYLIGLFDRPHESVRMESAIAKYACSEDIHELLTLVERAFGPSGLTEKYLLEKARRDSRILTIYEGTNEVQRFLILKDLIAQAADWPELPEQTGDPAARTLATWKNRLRKRVTDAAGLLGDVAWSDAMLQPALFPLSEMAGEILRLECIYFRREWLEARKDLLGREVLKREDGSTLPYAPSMIEASTRAAARTIARLTHLDRTFASAWDRVVNNMDMPEVRAADAALDRMAKKTLPAPVVPGAAKVPLRILCIVRPVADLSPLPRLSGGGVPRELVWKPDPLDLAGASQAISLKRTSDARVTVDILMAGGPEQERAVRGSVCAAADTIVRLNADSSALPGAYARAVNEMESSRKYNVIIAGSNCLNGERSLAAYLAADLGRPYVSADCLLTTSDGSGIGSVTLPAVIGITDGCAEQAPDLSSLVRSALSGARVVEAGTNGAAGARYELPAAGGKAVKTITTVHDAAAHIKAFAAEASAAVAEDYTGEVKPGSLPGANTVWSILDPRASKSNVAVLRGCRRAADLWGRHSFALIAAPRDEWPSLLGLAKANGAERAFCVDTKQGMLSRDGRRETLRLIMKASSAAVIAAGMEWIDAFGMAAGESDARGNAVRVLAGATEIDGKGGGTLTVSLPAYEGRLIRRETLENGPAFIAVSQEAEFPSSNARPDFAAAALDLAVKPEWLMSLPPAIAPTLQQADVIIDLGYGIKDRTGMELAIELKKRLEAMGLSPLFGATRKVTQDLKLLPLDAQIGQTGVRVNPRLIIALGISGAPQHIDYIGTRADIICFNKDPDAPLMKLNQARPAPRVHPVEGDLFVTVKELIEHLG